MLRPNCLQRTCELLGIVCRHSPQMPQIALVTNQHDDDVRVSMVSQLLQPPCDVLVCVLLANIVHEERADCASVVGRRDGPVTLLPRSIPDLSLDGLRIDLNRSRGEFDANGGLRVEVELIAGETAQEVGLSDTRVSDKDNWRGVLMKEFNAGCACWNTFEEELQCQGQPSSLKVISQLDIRRIRRSPL